jgi:hypothetical protein
MGNVYRDEIGRCYCSAHRRDRCHECCLDFVKSNEMTEAQAGLRKPPSQSEELAEEKVMLERGIAFMMQQPPSTRQEKFMRDNLEYHRKELARVERELKKLKAKGKNGEIQEAIATQMEQARAQDADLQSLTQAYARKHPGATNMEMGGKETQELYDQFVAKPPSSKEDQAADPYTCSYCRKNSTKQLPACARCKKQAYCSKACQKTHWKSHKKECQPVDTIPKGALPLTWAQLEEFQFAEGKKLEVRYIQQEPGMRLIALCKDRAGVTKRVAAYTNSRDVSGFTPGKVMIWKNPRFHFFMDGSNGARIEEQDLANITIL